MHSSLKKALSWTLSYGIIFSLPAGALLSRIAYAGADEKAKAEEKAKNPPAADKGKTPTKSSVQPSKAVTGKSTDHKSTDDDLESAEPKTAEGKPSQAPRTRDCSDPEFLIRATDSIKGAGRRCDKLSTPPLDTRQCWYQFFELLGAAQTNALIENNSLEAEKASQQAAAATITNGNYLIPALFPTNKVQSAGPKEDELKKVFVAMSDNSIQNKKDCCKKLTLQAQTLSSWILKTEDKDSKIHPQKIHDLLAQQSAACDKAPKAAVAAAHSQQAPVVTQNLEAPKKKKSIWPAVFWGLAAGALLFFLLYKRNKRKSSPPPTPPTTTTTTGGTGGTTYPVLTTTTTGRDITTGGTDGTSVTGGLTYPSDITGTSTGRDITTGGTGTVTGSTTATTTTSTSTTTGTTTASPSYPDLSTSGSSRTTGGTSRTITK